jgi:hypothetical protein
MLLMNYAKTVMLLESPYDKSLPPLDHPDYALILKRKEIQKNSKTTG